MTEKAPDTGYRDPEFTRVDIEALHKQIWKRPQRNFRFPWARHLELGRQNPNQWMLCSRVTKGGCRARAEVIHKDRTSIEGYLKRHFPCERWQLRQIIVPGTHCDRELYMRYLHTLTPEEDVLDRKRRREIHEQRMAVGAENKRRRDQRARDQAARDELAARQAIRGRRRPGQ